MSKHHRRDIPAGNAVTYQKSLGTFWRPEGQGWGSAIDASGIEKMLPPLDGWMPPRGGSYRPGLTTR